MKKEEDLAENYSVLKWIKTPKDSNHSPRTQIIIFGFNALLFGVLAITYFTTYWEGITEWWAITRLPWEEVKDSPYRSIWTSGKIIPAIIFAIASIIHIYLLTLFIKNKKS